MIEVEHLSKDYGSHRALDDVSFSVGAGEIVGFLGPNGAGKTTTLRILAGSLGPSRGRARIAGFDVQEQHRAAAARLGYMPESAPLYPEMRVREYLDFRAALKGIAPRERRRARGRALERAGAASVVERPIAQLSKGFRQRVALADALVADPPLLILDEPTAGLDPNQIREVRRLIAELRGEHTVLLSTHILPEVESVCQRALVVRRGQLVAQGSLDELRDLRRQAGLRLTVTDPEGRAEGLLSARPEIAQRVRAPSGEASAEWILQFTDTADPSVAAPAIIAELVGAHISILACEPTRPTLEQAFAELTTDAEPARKVGPPPATDEGP